MKASTCVRCGAPLTYTGRGRPRRRCGTGCVAEAAREYREAYYREHRPELLEWHRAHYEANREAIRERQHEYRVARNIERQSCGIACPACGEQLSRRTTTGLCGFCSEGFRAERYPAHA